MTAAGLRIVPLESVEAMAAAVDLFVEIWGGEPPITAELMRALAKAGNWVVGAYLEEGGGERLVAASVAFFGAPDERTMHSHITGVAPVAAGTHVGFALKVHQRDWALARGVREISWTFDPLVRRNAWFNLGKLAATAEEYLVDFYGPMHDEINADEPTDRLLVRWYLESAEVESAMAGRPRIPVVRSPGPPGVRHRLGVPDDIEALRRTDPGRAHAWRLTLRESVLQLLSQGYRIIGFDKETGYVLEKEAGS